MSRILRSRISGSAMDAFVAQRLAAFRTQPEPVSEWPQVVDLFIAVVFVASVAATAIGWLP